MEQLSSGEDFQMHFISAETFKQEIIVLDVPAHVSSKNLNHVAKDRSHFFEAPV